MSSAFRYFFDFFFFHILCRFKSKQRARKFMQARRLFHSF